MNPKKVLHALALRWSFLRRFHCVVCDHDIGGFLPFRSGWDGAPPVLRKLEVEGSDLDRFECPRCGAHDRERHLLLYLRATGLWNKVSGARILHAAPERRLSALIAAAGPAVHLRCDLFPAEPGVEKVDLQSIQRPDASFDLVIANHVLEHVADVASALAEISRVLAPGGHAILQTPFSRVLETTAEDASVVSSKERWASYGQEDHVRLFGRDVFARFESGMGAVFVGGDHSRLLPDVDALRFGVNPGEPFMLFRKPSASSRAGQAEVT